MSVLKLRCTKHQHFTSYSKTKLSN